MEDSTSSIYFDSFCAVATTCKYAQTTLVLFQPGFASNFMIKNDFLDVYTNKNSSLR